ncbi:MAG: hypothetical protein KJ646_02480 [Nanoarchaeota archaeon]|nr:hypothetical protein [Nanoarchaeota archaeon]MBU4116214.1 hypothetical protein [Nanoarchaeota archaeon]
MRKHLTLFMLFILLILPVISGVEFDMKSEFNQGETLMAKISGNFVEPILKENIFFYRGHVRISIEPYIAKINDEFYIYASLLGKEANNYSISIQDVKYMVGNKVSEEDIVRNFSITSDVADFYAEPGFVVTDEDFFIKVQNLKDTKITINININSENSSNGFFSLSDEIEYENQITLKSGEIKKINFNIEEITQSQLKTIKLSADSTEYNIPVYIFTSEEISDKKQQDFEFDPMEFNITMSTDSEKIRIIYLFNTGEENLENIILSVSDSLKDYISFSIEEIEELDENSSIKLEINIISDSEEKNLEGQIIAETENKTIYSAIFLNFVKDYIPLEELDEEIPRTTKTCEERNGLICGDNEECTGEFINAKDGVCCLETCEEIKESSIGQIIGWTLLAGIIIFLIWFFIKKYKGAKR